MKSDQLSAAQAGVQALRVLSVWLLVGVLALYGVAIWLARGAARDPAQPVRARARRSPRARPPAAARQLPHHRSLHPGTSRPRAAWLIGTSMLGQIGRGRSAYGASQCLTGRSAGPTAPGSGSARGGPPAERAAGNRLGRSASALLLVLWGGTHALPLVGDPAPGRPDRARRRRPAAPVVAGVPVPARSLRPRRTRATVRRGSPAEELAELNELHDAGQITDEEYAKAKQLVLA